MSTKYAVIAGSLVTLMVLVVAVVWLDGAQHDYRIEKLSQVTDSQGYQRPIWHPTNMAVLAYINDQGTYILNLNSGIQRQVSEEVAGFGAIWIQDGTALVYRGRENDKSAIKMMDIETGNVSVIASSTDLGLPQETRSGLIRYTKLGIPTSKSLGSDSVSGSAEMPFVYQIDEQIFADGFQLTQQPGRFFGPRVSPDGTKVLYQAFAQGLYVTDLRNGNTTHLGLGDDAVWAPDSKHIVFEITIDGEYSITASDLYIMDLFGNRVRLTDTHKIEMRPAWSPDGERLAFDADGAIYIAEMSD